MIPKEAIAAAAKAICMGPSGISHEQLEIALEAAAPYIRAESLENAAKLAEMGEGGGTDSGECEDWSTWIRAQARVNE